MEIVSHRLNMTTIEIKPSKRPRGWCAFETPSVEPAFPDPNGKQNAIDYARGRFGGSRGEIHVYCDDGSTVERSTVIDSLGQYPQSG